MRNWECIETLICNLELLSTDFTDLRAQNPDIPGSRCPLPLGMGLQLYISPRATALGMRSQGVRQGEHRLSGACTAEAVVGEGSSDSRGGGRVRRREASSEEDRRQTPVPLLFFCILHVYFHQHHPLPKNREGLTRWLIREWDLPPSLRTWVQSLALTWWKENQLPHVVFWMPRLVLWHVFPIPHTNKYV